MPDPSIINKYRYSDVINRRYWDNKYFFDSMSVNPGNTKVGGGAAAGASAETDVMITNKNAYEYFNIVGNTNLGPKLDGTFGLNLAPDATSTHGVEYNTGVTPQNNFTFLINQNPVGTNPNPGNTANPVPPGFFLKAQLQLTTANGASVFMGFRKLQANNATFASYTDFATMALVAGEFEIETQLATGGVVITDTTQAAANLTPFEIAVFVDPYGNVTYQINGAPPVVTAAYQFANALTVMPFLRIVQNATTTATVSCNYFECGYQDILPFVSTPV